MKVRSIRRYVVLGVVVAVVCGVVSSAPAEVFDFVSLILPAPASSSFHIRATGINDLGDIVGYNGDDFGFFMGFLLDRVVFVPVDVPVPGSDFVITRPFGINNRRQIVGSVDLGVRDGHPLGQAGFLLTRGSYQIIFAPFTGAHYTELRGINNAGLIVGNYADASGLHGFLLDDRVFSPIDVPGADSTVVTGINDMKQIVGVFFHGRSVEGFVLSSGTYTFLEGPSACFCATPEGINNRGEIVGTYPGHGFLLADGVYTSIDAPFPAISTMVTSINNRGTMVGWYLVGGSGETRSFLAAPSENL